MGKLLLARAGCRYRASFAMARASFAMLIASLAVFKASFAVFRASFAMSSASFAMFSARVTSLDLHSQVDGHNLVTITKNHA